MIRRRLTAWLIAPALLLAGCVAAPVAAPGGQGDKEIDRLPPYRPTVKGTLRTLDSAYAWSPDVGTARGWKFQDVIPVGARITAVNVATDGGILAIWLSYKHNGVVSDTPRRGGAGGVTEVFKLRGNEKLVGLDGSGRGAIDQLTVVTDQRVKTFSKTGFSGIHSSWITDEQQRQYVGVGITGRADDRLRLLSLRFQVRE